MSSQGLALENARTQRTAIKVSGLALLSLSFQTLGIIYSDIGTSPLYVLNGIWPSSGPLPSKEDVIGGVSAILWSLTLLPFLKYVFVCLYFGTHEGEGGTFALFQGLYPSKAYDPGMERSLTGGSFTNDKHSARGGRQISKHFKWPLLAWSLLGTSLTLADGIFTPAVSVTSAVGGIAVAKKSASNNITGIAIAFLVVLFLVQQLGTARIARVYSPVTFIWFLLLAGTGIANITHHPGIFRAFDPSRAVMLFVRTKNYDLLAGILLAITGCEALFANLGQFNMLSIQISFATITYPALCLAYLGQGARLISDGEAVFDNIFYLTIPGKHEGPLFWIVFVFAILATLIASQALITATFSLVQQLVNMRSLPPLGLVYTSETIQGQVYIPMVNWALMIAVIIVVAAFKDLAAMTNAYGFSVATVMFTTTVLISIQAYYVKRWPIVVALGIFVFFGFLDGLFWGAGLRKVPHGAWVPLLIGVVLMSFMVFWTWAKGLEDRFDGANRRNLRRFIIAKDLDEDGVIYQLPKRDSMPSTSTEEGGPAIHYTEPHRAAAASRPESLNYDSKQESYYYMAPSRGDRTPLDEKNASFEDASEEKRELVRISTCAIFHKLSAGKGVPHSFVGFIRQWPALPRVVIFLSVHVLPIARVPEDERYVVNKVHAVQGFYATTYYLGFRDDFDVRVDEVIERVCALEHQLHPNEAEATCRLIRECAATSTHIVPHYHVVSRRMTWGPAPVAAVLDWTRSLLIDSIYRNLSAMFPETKNWLSSADEIIHVGVNATI